MRTIKIAIILFFLMTGQVYAADGMRISISPENIEFHLVNPKGLITGYTPNGILNQIKEVDDYALWGSPSTDISNNPYDKCHVVNQDGYPAYVSPGKYRLNIYGTTLPIQAKINVEYWWINQGLKGPRYNNLHLIYPNVIWLYEFDMPTIPTNDGQIILTKVSTPADFIKDIRTAGQLGYIGNPKFVKYLTERVMQVALLKGDQKKGYEDISSELTSLYSKPEQDRFIKKEGYDVLKEDLDYIIGHL